MKKIQYSILILLSFACNSEDANDCFQTSGTIIQQRFDVIPFSRILVNRDVELVLTEGPNFEVLIETGENLLNDVEVTVQDNQLQLTDNNTCNFVRDFGLTRAFVTAPNITEIRSSTQFDISSNGILNYENISLLSEDFNAPGSFTVGDFRLQINSSNLIVVSNGSSFFFIEGMVNALNVNFVGGSSRFEGRNLVAEDVSVFHRASNDIVINPQASVTGSIVNVGDVILVNTPPFVEVEERFRGRLIFE